MNDNGPDSAGLLYGLAAIAGYLGVTERQAEHIVANAEFPSFKIGRRVCSTKSAIGKWFLADMMRAEADEFAEEDAYDDLGDDEADEI